MDERGVSEGIRGDKKQVIRIRNAKSKRVSTGGSEEGKQGGQKGMSQQNKGGEAESVSYDERPERNFKNIRYNKYTVWEKGSL